MAPDIKRSRRITRLFVPVPDALLRITADAASSASPPSTVSVKRPWGLVVSAHVSPRDRKPAFRSVIVARVFRRSRRRACQPVEPGHHQDIASAIGFLRALRRPGVRSVFTPLAVSTEHFFEHLAALVSWRTCASTL